MEPDRAFSAMDGSPSFPGENLVVSYRQPYTHWHGPESIECARPKGVLMRHFDHLLKTRGGTWIASSSGNADRLVCNPNDEVLVPPQNGQYALKRLWLDKQKEQFFYYGFCCSGIWSLFHTPPNPEKLAPDEFLPYEPMFLANHWQAYQDVNKHYAQVVAKTLAGNPLKVWVLEHSLALVPRLLKDLVPATVQIHAVWTIAWPAWPIAKQCPWIHNLVQGLLGSDAILFSSPASLEGFAQAALQVGATWSASGNQVLSHQGKRIPLSLFSPQIGQPTKTPSRQPIDLDHRPSFRSQGHRSYI